MMEKNNIPKHWQIKKLGEIIEINPKLPKKEEIPNEMEVQFLPMKLVEEIVNKIHLTETRKFTDVLKGSYTPFINGDIIFAKVTPCMENGKIAVVKNLKNGIGFGSSEFHVLRPKENTLDNYIFYFIVQDKFRNQAQHEMTGAVGLRRVPKKFIEDYLIPLPPLPEQHAIVSKIEELFSELDNGKQQLQTALQQLKVYRQSLLKAAFEGKLTNKNVKGDELPKGWIIKKLNEIGTWKGGGTPSKSKIEFWENGDILWVSPKDMKSQKIYDTIDKITNDAIENSSTKLIPKDSILFVVRSGILRRTLPIALTVSDLTVNQDLQALTPKDVLADYVYWYVSAKNEDIRKTCSKDGTTVESIESSLLKNYLIPICSHEEQKRIVQELESKLTVCDKIEETITQSLQQAETLRQSILKQAFEGKLV